MPIDPPDESESYMSRCPARPGQTLYNHSSETAMTMEALLRPLGLGTIGWAIAWLHDMGKMSKECTGYLELAGRDAEKASQRRGTIDHSSAGAQFIWKNMPADKQYGASSFMRQIMALCVASHHHSSLIDCWRGPTEKEAIFLKRMRESTEKTHYDEVVASLTDADKKFYHALLNDEAVVSEMDALYQAIGKTGANLGDSLFLYGLMARCVYSALTEADYRSASGRGCLAHLPVPDWSSMQSSLEHYVARFSSTSELNALRAGMSIRCLQAGSCAQGLWRLALPTGAGKTLSSLRFALEHARIHHLERIVYVIPYTTILDQVALAFQEALGKEWERSLLVHHSNLVMESKESEETVPWSQEKKNWYLESSEQWNVPIVLTTAVQFLNAMYASGKQHARRMHALKRSVVIFDEVQAIPWTSRELFVNAVRFWVTLGRSTVLFCTATQEKPAPDSRLAKIDRGSLIGEVEGYFRKMEALRKCAVSVRLKNAQYWTLERIAELAVNHAREDGTVLVVVNTKPLAANLATACRSRLGGLVYHLSTSMCPAHREEIVRSKISKKALAEARENRVPVICVSTQLIEAGVDLDFDVVIRSMAGLDSCMQAAGRCNRDARLGQGKVILLNPADCLEKVASLKEIQWGRDKTTELLKRMSKNEDVFTFERMQSYYAGIDTELRKLKWSFYLDSLNGVSTNLVEALSLNRDLVEDGRNKEEYKTCSLFQAFASAARSYRVIDDKTVQVVTSFGEGKRLVEELKSMNLHTDSDWKLWKELLREARRYSVSLPAQGKTWTLLLKSHAVYPIKEGMEIYILSPDYYDDFLGCTTDFGSLIL